MYKVIIVTLAIVLPVLLIAAYKETHMVWRDGVCKLPKDWREADRARPIPSAHPILRFPFNIAKVRHI